MTGDAGDPQQAAALLLLIGAAGLLAVSGVPGLFLSWRSARGQRLATTLAVAGSLVGIAGGVMAIGGRGAAVIEFTSPVPGLRSSLGADALGAFFALPVFLVGGLGALYGASYWSPRRHPRNGRRLRFCYGLLQASMVLITLARDGILLLVAWEGMALASFFLITTEDDDSAIRRAGWLYLLYSHLTILCLFALVVVQTGLGGDFGSGVIPAGAPAAMRAAVFALALIAFGAKAGAIPLHSWLPAAHASAPGHVSAVMSGVMIKMGIYGLVRVSGLVDQPPLSWGVTLLVAGTLSAFFGVVFAIAQHDLKRLLAYHSIENIGIILLGLGLAMVGRSEGRPDWVVLGLAGCLLHVWNHALFKSLLFLGASAVVRATASRDLERTGGLARRMPYTAGLFLLGAVAISGLPPLNGFVSEFFVYLGLARAALTPGSTWTALPAPALAATGALAVACFVKVYGIVFLGTPRSKEAAEAREAPAAMLAPMAILGAACAVIGAAPLLVAPAIESATAVWTRGSLPEVRLASLAPLGWISAAAVALLAGVAALAAWMLRVARRARLRQPSLPTWDCGYAATSPRLQYTASSFAEIITSRFAWILLPRVRRPRLERFFPAPSTFHTHVEDSLLDRLLEPAAREALRLTARARAMPQGLLQRYILYILAVLVPLLAWAIAGGGGR
jgi:hydrogenase-4 component B